MTSTSGGQSIRLEVISGNNISVPSGRIPAGIYVSVNVNPRRCWKSTARVLSSDDSVAWGDTVILSRDTLPTRLSLEIRASFELGRMLGDGEVISKLETSWNELLDHGDEPFDLTFLPADDDDDGDGDDDENDDEDKDDDDDDDDEDEDDEDDDDDDGDDDGDEDNDDDDENVYPSLTLKATVVCAQGIELDSVTGSEIACRTDAGHMQFAKYMTDENESDLKNAVQHFQFVLDRCPVGHPDHAAALTNLAWACLKGYICKDLQDIDSTIFLFRDALALCPQGHPDRASSIYHLTEALTWRYIKQDTPADIHESVQLYHELLPLCPEGTYLRNIAAGDDGVDYVINACNNLPTDASDEGIQLRRVVLELCPLSHQYCPTALDELALAVQERFNQHGSIEDLEESIKLGREAVSLCPEGHPDRAKYLNDLANSIRSRFSQQGKSDDLDEAISLSEEALLLYPVGHEFRDVSLDNLGLTLHSRFVHRNDINDINKAIGFFRESLSLCPPGHPGRDTVLSNLALVLSTRYDEIQASEDLDEAIDLYRESLRLTQPDDPERHTNLNNLSSALCSRFTENQAKEDVEEAIDLCQRSLSILPPLHPGRYFSYMQLQEAYLSRYEMQDNPIDLSLAMENFRLASGHPTQGYPSRIKEAIDWALQAEIYQHESALEAYQVYLKLFDNHVMTRSSIISRRDAATAFRGAQSLPVDAASCAIRRNNLQRAVELEEQGRGQQWSLASRLRTPLDDLKSASLPLANKLSELSKRLSDAQGSTGSADRASADRAAAEYRKLTEQWEVAVAEVRNLQGFSRFLLPLSYEDLQVAARHGPVIILIASEYSRNAIIIPTSGQPHHVPFPDLTFADVEQLKDDFAKAIQQASFMGPKQPRTGLKALLRKIWDEVMLLIVRVLQRDLRLPGRSRIWLCPTAAFTSIPLHAANPFRTKADCSELELCLEDVYICSYTPTLSALIRARQTMKTHLIPSFVAIGQGQPGAGQGKELLTVESELELVRSLVPATVNPITLSGDAATRAGALEALQNNTWVHLACHGKQDHDQPYYSHFAMKDEPLTLLDIMENDAPQAEFAFLSACHTAAGDEETPDEAIHLAAGLQFSGFKSVIGTLWVVDDAVAKHVVKAFYENLFKDLKEGDMPDCTKAAWALNKATYAVKMKVPLEQRIVFVHIGV
ncbi:CHAT domain-containing protein [Suillus subaureus]|uniref:CHAT domain-containing protein n=1 Tax=Suillus subaureus TaxID=48587 RepID=A0A9P7EFC0_9AGAM|nr:CHAT domain-containing protein [Suillus subaureus]KAG1819310.1 CHAT domain-containing protein [Suillus subaureus]